MARIRTIKPEFPQSESMGRVSRDARLCFIELWTIADDSGRLRGAPRMLASLLFPYDDDAGGLISGWLEELEREECLIQYQAEGQHYIQITNWFSHQKIDKRTASKIPSPPNPRESSPNPREDSAEPADYSSEDQGPRTKDQGMDQGEDPSRTEEDPKPSKHEYGSEKNVLMTDAQYSSLKDDLGLPLLTACIEELSTAKAMKGYKYKRDDLAIRKWVIDKVKKDRPSMFQPQAAPRPDPSPPSTLDPEIMAMLERNYGKDKPDA